MFVPTFEILRLRCSVLLFNPQIDFRFYFLWRGNLFARFTTQTDSSEMFPSLCNIDFYSQLRNFPFDVFTWKILKTVKRLLSLGYVVENYSTSISTVNGVLLSILYLKSRFFNSTRLNEFLMESDSTLSSLEHSPMKNYNEGIGKLCLFLTCGDEKFI